jgi:multidrug efflux system membrane fusion protein
MCPVGHDDSGPSRCPSARLPRPLNLSRTELLALGLLSLFAAGCAREAAPSEPLRAVRTATVSATEAGGSLEFAAEVRARTETRLSVRVGGKLMQRLVESGQVKAG